MRSWWKPQNAAAKDNNLLVSLSSTHAYRPHEEKLEATLWGILPIQGDVPIHADGDASPTSRDKPGDWDLEMDDPKIHEETPIDFDAVRTLVSVVSVTVGGGHVIFVAKEGLAFAYGCNVHGQLGVGDFENREIPCQVQGLSASPPRSHRWRQASQSSSDHSSGEEDVHEAQRWNESKVAFEDGSWEDVHEGPKDGTTGAWAFISAAACGQDHTVFLARRGAGVERQRVFACGAFEFLGLDSEYQENRPRPQMLLEPVGGVAIAARGLTSCCVAPAPFSAELPELAVSADRRSPHQLQPGHAPPAREHWICLWGEVQCCPRPGLFEVPTPFFRLPTAPKLVSLGASFGLALDVVGNVYAWGDGSYGELGGARGSEPPNPGTLDGDAGSTLPLPRRIALPVGRHAGESGNGSSTQDSSGASRLQRPRVVDIACGERHALLLDEAGRLYAFGENFSGQCGVAELGGNSAIVPRPRLVPVHPARAGEDTPVGIRVFAGRRHSAMITEGGRLYMWGHPANRKLGHAGSNPDGTEAGESPSKPRPPGVAVRSPLRDAVRQPRIVNSLQRNLQTLGLGDECSIFITGSVTSLNSLRAASSSESSDHQVPSDRRNISIYMDSMSSLRVKEPPAPARTAEGLPPGKPRDKPPAKPAGNQAVKPDGKTPSGLGRERVKL